MQGKKAKGGKKKSWVDGEVTDEIKTEVKDLMQSMFLVDAIDVLGHLDWKGKCKVLIEHLQKENEMWDEFDGRYWKNTNRIFKWIYQEIKNHFRRLSKNSDKQSCKSEKDDEESKSLEDVNELSYFTDAHDDDDTRMVDKPKKRKREDNNPKPEKRIKLSDKHDSISRGGNSVANEDESYVDDHRRFDATLLRDLHASITAQQDRINQLESDLLMER